MPVRVASSPTDGAPPDRHSGSKFVWADWKPLVDMFPQCWPAVRDNMPLLAGWAEKDDEGNLINKKYDTKFGLPPSWDTAVKLNELLIEDTTRGPALWDNVNKALSSRPQTWIHGDYNPGPCGLPAAPPWHRSTPATTNAGTADRHASPACRPAS